MRNWPTLVWISLIPALSLAVLAALLPFLAPIGKRPPDEAWHGFFYSNPNDPALLVPKRYGMGYTLNFGNRWAWPLLAIILLMAVLPILLIGVTTHNLAGLRNHR